MQVAGECFYAWPILHGGGYMGRKGALLRMSARAGGLIDLVFGTDGLYDGEVYDLAGFYEHMWQMAKVAAAVVAVAGFVGYHLIGYSTAWQGGAGVSGLAAGFFAAAFSKALVLLGSVRVL